MGVNTGSGDAGYNNGYNNGYAAGLKAGQGVPFMNATPVAPAPVTYAGAACYTAPTTTVSNSNYVPAGVTPVYTGYTASPAVVQQEFVPVMGEQELAVIEPVSWRNLVLCSNQLQLLKIFRPVSLGRCESNEADEE